MTIVTKKCPICSINSDEVDSHPDFKRISVFYCDNCKYGFTDLDEKESDAKLFLKNYYYSEYREERCEEVTEEYLTGQKKRAEEQCKYISNYVNLANVERVFDVGCSTGSLLDNFKSSIRYGSEFDFKFATIAKSKGIILVNDLADIEDQSLDLLTSSHSLEHLNDPYDFIITAYEKLLPGGYLFIEVPNDNRLTVERIVTNQARLGHLHFFSTQSLKKYLKDKFKGIFALVDISEAGSKQKYKYISNNHPESKIFSCFINNLNRAKSFFAGKIWIRVILKKC